MSAETASATAPTETTDAAPATVTEETPKLEGEALKEAVKKQIEYYFSKENLQGDAYLVSQMDSQLYVPIAVVAGFKMMKNLTTDTKLLMDVIKNSDKVSIDETGDKIRPNFQHKRSTIILRDIPKDTPLEEVKKIFDSDKCPKISSDENIRADVCNTWFVSFDTEEETMEALAYLRAGAKFQDKTVRCAVKSENILKSLYYADSRQPMQPMYMDPNFGYVAGRSWNGDARGRRTPGGRRGGPAVPGGRPQDYGMVPGQPRTKKGARATRKRDSPMMSGMPGHMGAPQTLLSPAHFPPLPSKGSDRSGYGKTFKKYSKDQIIGIIQAATKVEKLENMDNNCVVVLPNADVDLEINKKDFDRRVSLDFDATLSKDLKEFKEFTPAKLDVTANKSIAEDKVSKEEPGSPKCVTRS